MLVTVFLLVLILALALGNLFLSITSPNSATVRRMLASSPVAAAGQGAGAEGEAPLGAGNGRAGAMGSEDFEAAANGERVRMLNKRIDRMESLLLKINNAKFVAKKLNGTNLVQKLNDLQEFRENAVLEIEALKQQLAAMKNEKPEEKKEADISEKEMHDLIYQGSEN